MSAKTAAPPEALQHNAAHEREPIAGPSTPTAPYPIYLEGPVVRGFGRGSKDLGCPTANFPEDAIASCTKQLETGVHFGYAKVEFSRGREGSGTEHDAVFGMVMSIGWNPYYKNEKRTLEVHVLHDYHADFYNHHLRIAILGYIRPEFNYTSLRAS